MEMQVPMRSINHRENRGARRMPEWQLWNIWIVVAVIFFVLVIYFFVS
jgi:hypothetical protein